MSKLGNFDINELILQLHSEMKLAFEITQSAEQTHGLRIDSIKTRFGRKDNGPLGAVPEEENLEILNGQRYPNEEDWEVEVNYRHGLPVPEIPQSKNWVSSYDSQRIIQKLGNVSIINIKGVNTVWGNRFEKSGISTINELAGASAQKIQQLCKEFNTLKPHEFQVKVLLLVRNFQPFRYTEFKDISLNSLLQYSQIELKTIFKHQLTGPEISELKSMASIIYLVFDSHFTSKLMLAVLA